MLTPVSALVGLLVIWESTVRALDIKPFLLPAPSLIVTEFVANFGLLTGHAAATVFVTLLGFGMAIIFGVLLAVAIVWSRRFEQAVYPLIVLTQVIPKVAIAPLLIVYLGFGLQPKVFLAFLVCFFPMVINTTLGLKAVGPELMELLTSLRATKWQILWKVRAHRAIPFVVEGAKIAVTLAVIGAVVGEFVAGNEGLGYVITTAASRLDTPLGFAALTYLSVIGIVLFECTNWFGGRIVQYVMRTN